MDSFESTAVAKEISIKCGLADLDTIIAMSLVQRLSEVFAHVFAQHSG
jgi:hypothetical protein